MNLDRNLQRKILELGKSCYPNIHSVDFNDPEQGSKEYHQQLAYLTEHNLIQSDTEMGHGFYAFAFFAITAIGLDFLEEDGGMDAILKTVTIRLHGDTIRQLLESKIIDADLEPQKKRRLLEAIRNAPSTAFSKIVQDLTSLALSQVPAAFQLLQSNLLSGL